MTAEFNEEAGINTQVFETVKEVVATWKKSKRYCSILFDDITLEAGLSYEDHKDAYDEFVEINEKTDVSNKALVFLLRGTNEKWQRPLVFYYCQEKITTVLLKKIITDVIVAVRDTGLLPVALVIVEDTASESAVKELQECTRREQILAGDEIDDVIKIKGHTLRVIYDAPYLMRGVRNDFLTKNIKYEQKISKWSDIVQVYKIDSKSHPNRVLKKLNDEDVIPEKIDKTKVKHCIEVLSRTVASLLSFTAGFGKLEGSEDLFSDTLRNTSQTVLFFDQLFDSVNGHKELFKRSKKPLRWAVTESSPNHTFWEESIEKLESIRFIDNSGNETTPPSLQNWITTLKSYQRLWRFFKSEKIRIMYPRFFNSELIIED